MRTWFVFLFVITESVSFARNIDSDHVLETAESIALHMMAEHNPKYLKWNWQVGVGLYGLMKIAKKSDRTREQIHAYVRSYITAQLKKNPAITHADRCPPALAALALYEDSADEMGLGLANRVAHYIKTEKRNPLGALNHLGSKYFLSFFYPQSIWVDSLMMYAVFGARWASFSHDPQLLDFALEQPMIFSTQLQEPESGLFRHAWFTKQNRPYPKSRTFWLRGNGWVGASIVEMLPYADPQRRQTLSEILRRLVEGTLPYRLKSGLWGTLINLDSYEEVSGSALIAYAMARGAREGIFPSNYRDLSEETFWSLMRYLHLTKHGYAVGGVSGPTNPSSAFMYRLVPRGRDYWYGVGAVLLFLDELLEP